MVNTIKSKDDLYFSKSDFITTNTGKFREFYALGPVLGTGAFGEVRLCTMKRSHIKRAVKIIQKNQMDTVQEDSFKSEVATLKKLDHPNILKLYEVFEDDNDFFMVMELMQGGELFERIVDYEKYCESMAAESILPIVDALNYCH